MKLSERVDHLEMVVVKHLEESGSIRTDIAWLKKAFWTLTIAVVTAATTHFIPLGGPHESSTLPQVQQISRNH